MKKTIAILMTLCLLCASCAALADTEAPTFDSLPLVVSEDENTTIEEADFEGEWVLSAAFLNREYLDPQTLAESIGFNFEPIVIGNGKIQQDVQQENGEFVTTETEYTLDGSQLGGPGRNRPGVCFRTAGRRQPRYVHLRRFREGRNRRLSLPVPCAS